MDAIYRGPCGPVVALLIVAIGAAPGLGDEALFPPPPDELEAVVRLSADPPPQPAPATPPLGVIESDDPAQPDAALAGELAVGEGIQQFARGRYMQALEQLENSPPTEVTAAYYRALSHLGLGQPESAIGELETVVAAADAPAEARLDLGMAQVLAGRNSEAVSSLEKYLAESPDDAVAEYFLGVALYRTGQKQRSQPHFLAAADEPGIGEFASEYNRMLTTPDRVFRSPAAAGAQAQAPAEPPKNYNLTFLSAYEHDSNLTLSPVFNGLGDNIARDADRMILALFGDVRVAESSNWVVGLTGSVFSSFHATEETNNFDLQDYMGGAYANYLMGPFLSGVHYEYHDTRLQGDKFGGEHRLVPNVSILEGEFGHTTFFYEYDNATVYVPALISAQDRSADVHAVGVTQAIYTTEGKGRVFAGYRFEQAYAEGADFDRQTSQVNGRIEQPICEKLIVDGGIRYFWDNYSNPNSLDILGRSRDDERLECRAGTQWFITDCLSARVDYTYVNADSNVANLFGVRFFDFNRHVLSTQMIIDF